jgi:large subunit ribosomal protein L15
MTKLNELAPRPGSHKARMRVGRGPGSGKGKTAGRGVKGQTSRTGAGMDGFEGGQMPLHMRAPKRGFNNPFAKKLVEVNLWRLAQAIEAGKLDPKAPVDGAAMVKAGVIRRERDGVRLLGQGELKAKLNITCHSATASAKAAIETAGGKLTLTRVEAAPAPEKPEEKPAKKQAKPAPQEPDEAPAEKAEAPAKGEVEPDGDSES